MSPSGKNKLESLTKNHKIKGVLLILCVFLCPSIGHSLHHQAQLKSDPNKEGPTTVYIGLVLLDMINLDQPKQLLRARYALTLKWKDPRLAFDSDDGKPAIFTGDEVNNQINNMWWPDPQIINQLGERVLLNNRLVILPDGEVLYSKVFVVDTETILEFLKFPFDSQTIRIEFESFSYSHKELDYKVWGQRTGVNQDFHSDEWVIYDMSSISGIRRLWASEVDNYSYVSFSVPIHRRTAYYLWRVLLPFCFFILLSTCIFWMHQQSLDRRVSIVVAFALTAVAFNFVVSGFIPNVSYLTILDALILSGYLMCGCTIVSAISLDILKQNGKGKIWNYGNIAARFVFPLIYIVVWIVIYELFMNLEEQIVYFVEHRN